MRVETDAPGPTRRARALLELGRLEAAMAAAREALSDEPRQVEALELLGLCLLRLERADEACVPLREALRHAPERAHLHYLIGHAASLRGDDAEAERGLREAARLGPEEPVYLRALAEWLAGHGRGDEGLMLAERAVATGPECAMNHRALGFVASATGRLDRAEQAYREALRLDPLDADAWNNLGCVELAHGEKLEARAAFREALRLRPAGAAGERARRNLALVLPKRRPRAIYDEVEAFLGEALRELLDAGRLGASLDTVALLAALGQPAVTRALTLRLEDRGARERLGVAVGTAAVAALARRLGPSSLTAAGAVALVAGGAWLATARKVTPRRRRYAAHVHAARRGWGEARTAWLAGELSRTGREAAVDRLLEALCVALDREGDAVADAGTDATRDQADGQEGPDERDAHR